MLTVNSTDSRGRRNAFFQKAKQGKQDKARDSRRRREVGVEDTAQNSTDVDSLNSTDSRGRRNAYFQKAKHGKQDDKARDSRRRREVNIEDTAQNSTNFESGANSDRGLLSADC